MIPTYVPYDLRYTTPRQLAERHLSHQLMQVGMLRVNQRGNFTTTQVVSLTPVTIRPQVRGNYDDHNRWLLTTVSIKFNTWSYTVLRYGLITFTDVYPPVSPGYVSLIPRKVRACS